MAYNVGRLDQIIGDLERLQHAADDIINGYVNRIVFEASSGASWGGTKYRLVAPAGHVLNRVAALKIVRRALTGKDDRKEA
jgi:hypothetical protein